LGITVKDGSAGRDPPSIMLIDISIHGHLRRISKMSSAGFGRIWKVQSTTFLERSADLSRVLGVSRRALSPTLSPSSRRLQEMTRMEGMNETKEMTEMKGMKEVQEKHLTSQVSTLQRLRHQTLLANLRLAR